MRDSLIRSFVILVISFVFVFALFNFINQMHHAQNKELWGDEIFSLRKTIQGNSYLGLILKADVITEVNTAPLDYLFTKMSDDLGKPYNYFDLSQKVYFRLWANFVMVFSGFIVVCLFAISILRSSISSPVRYFQLLLLVSLPVTYLYRPMTYYYAAEVRPYSLWFALWFISIAICSMPRTNKFFLSLCLSLLALTMVGSIFQILAVALAYFILKSIEQGFKQSLKEALQIFFCQLL